MGPLEVRDGSGLVRVPGALERALLAELVVHAGRVVSADRLIEDLWGDGLPAKPVNALQGRVSALRRVLGSGVVVWSPAGYRLVVAAEQLDVGRFERLVAEAEVLAGPDPVGAVGLLEAALGLWRGPALVEFAERPWAQVEAARLEELRLVAQEAWVGLGLAAGGHGGLVGGVGGVGGGVSDAGAVGGQSSMRRGAAMLFCPTTSFSVLHQIEKLLLAIGEHEPR